MREHIDTVVIGGGQAGLSMSHALGERGLEHVVLERRRVAERWRTERWDSLRFQFPNWTLRFPGFAYRGTEPHAFASSREVADFIEAYARHLNAPVRRGVEVSRVTRNDKGTLLLDCGGTEIESRHVVLATGPFQAARVPASAARLTGILHIHSTSYRQAGMLPAGAVLVVGSGSSGCQIAEELHQAGRTVFLSVSQHRRAPRRYRGLDLVEWLYATGRFDTMIDSIPGRRIPGPLLLTGADGGHDVDLRQFAASGIRLVGRFRGIEEGELVFEDDVEENLRFADESFVEFLRNADAYADALDLPRGQCSQPLPSPVASTPLRIDPNAERIGTIIWCTGFRFEFDWVQLPIFNARSEPEHRRGVTRVPGAYFIGLHWMHTMKSGTLFGVHDDAAYVASHIAARA